ncbi:bifunctional oligoribonuclease/PAP phosphatase NrnA [candidate division KSB1 bacterium]|nr:bifunctional oligoribonuclease/PAP phosphatase NrnA [candidate division KSB1 bacterium]
MVDRTSLEKVRDCIERGQHFVLTTHVNPDGDGLGSEAALAAFLTDMGKDVFIFNSSQVPDNYKFLDPDNNIKVYESESDRETLLTADCIFILDISDWDRLKQVGKDIRDSKITQICIDHHPTNFKFADINLIDTKACSTGELVYDFLRFCDTKITKQIAEALYTSILTDTGWFQFSNSSAKAFSIVADLVKNGARPDKIYEKVRECESINKVKLFAHALRTLRLEHGGRIAVMTVTKDLIDSIGAQTYDTEGFADYPRRIDGVEVTALFIEREKGEVKLSLRSKGKYVINGIAQQYGGGGHQYAAGVLLEGELNQYVERIVEEISYLFK